MINSVKGKEKWRRMDGGDNEPMRWGEEMDGGEKEPMEWKRKLN